MPTAFNTIERREIRTALLSQGKDLFAKYGLKRTGIADLTQAAGIAQGSFYLFYKSKEELYFDILEREEQELGRTILANLSDKDLTRKSLKKMLENSLELICGNSFIRNLIENNEYGYLVRKIPKKKMRDHLLAESQLIKAAVRRFQSEGSLKRVRPEVMGGLLHALFLLYLERKTIGEEIFPDVLELVIDAIADALATKGARNLK
jgi:AcrR family transcriptional regulator